VLLGNFLFFFFGNSTSSVNDRAKTESQDRGTAKERALSMHSSSDEDSIGLSEQ
jgi:hypothetical protein